MLKKLMKAAFVLSLLSLGFGAQAQKSGNNALGVRFDLGDGGTYFGFAGKHYFTEQGAVEAHLLFASGGTMLGGEYQHHFDIASASGLKWYVGGGIGFIFYKSIYGYNPGTLAMIRPVGGLAYQLPSAPVNLGFDWRPMIGLNQGGGFVGGRFGLAARYVF